MFMMKSLGVTHLMSIVGNGTELSDFKRGGQSHERSSVLGVDTQFIQRRYSGRARQSVTFNDEKKVWPVFLIVTAAKCCVSIVLTLRT